MARTPNSFGNYNGFSVGMTQMFFENGADLMIPVTAATPLPVTSVAGGSVTSTPAASEVHLGSVGGTTPLITPTITVDTAVYASGDCCGGKITLTSAVRVSGGTGVWQSLMVLDRSGQKPTGELFIFDSDPTVATLTDNAAISLSTDDLKVLAKLTISASDYVTVNTKAYANIRGIGAVLKAVSGTSLYAAFALTNAPDFVLATDLQMRFGILAD